MQKYILKRLLAVIPTLIGITLVCFVIINLAPGSPVERAIYELRFGVGGEAGTSVNTSGGGSGSSDRGTGGIPQEVLDQLKKQYGFDKPLHMRYLLWLKNITTFDFGDSFTYEEPALDVIISKLPISLQFGLVSFFLVYLICIPLGVFMAVRDGSAKDLAATVTLIVMYSIPPLMLGILLIVFLGGGSFLDLFPIHGAYSDHYDTLSFFGKVGDRIHHFVLPLICYMIGSFTVLSFLMKNTFLDELRLNYVRTAQAKGLSEKVVLYKHTLRNALIPIVTGFGSFLSVFFAGSLIIETIFTLDGIGLLSYKALLDRDYNLIMALIFLQSLFMLIGRIISDFLYVVVDPRIDFS